MNLYFLVEGRRSEKKLYPKWLGHLLPQFTPVYAVDKAVEHNYYLFSGEGYPSLLNHFLNAVEDVRNYACYTHLVVCLDADEETVDSMTQTVVGHLEKHGVEMPAHCGLYVIVQNRCIETWLLGNKKMLSRNPTQEQLRNFTQFFDVSQGDPEVMSRPADYATHSQFHCAYLQVMFREKQLSYTKRNPGIAGEVSYLDSLIRRISDDDRCLQSFRKLITLCDDIRNRL